MLSTTRALIGLLAIVAATGCSGEKNATPPAGQPASAAQPAPPAQPAPAADDAPLPATASPYDALPEGARSVMNRPFTGDFDEMVKRRMIRFGVTFNRTHYFIDAGQERGLTAEYLKLFEDDLNKQLKTGNLKVHVVIVPMPRNQLYPALASGKIDAVAAMVTIRPEAEALAAFSVPTRTNVNEVVVLEQLQRFIGQP